MSIVKKESKKLRQATATGDAISTSLLDAVNTSEIITLSTVASKITFQSSGTLAFDYTVSANGINFVAGASVAANTLASYNTHNVIAVTITRTAGAGRVSILAVS